MSKHDGRQDFGSADPLVFPNGFITNAMVNSAAAIEASKVNHAFSKSYSQSKDAVVAADTGTIIHTFHYAGTVESVYVGIDVAPTGGDLDYDVDVQMSDGGGAWTTILTSAVTIDATDTDRVAVAGSISGTVTAAAGDMIRVVITTSGSTGTQGYGVDVDVLMTQSGQ